MAQRLIAGAAMLATALPFAGQSSAQPTATPSSAAGNAAAGARQYLQCRACHTATRGGAHGVGPNLWGIMGAKAATRSGYAYSPALAAAEFRWTPDMMDAFLARPNARVPGNKMAFAGVANPAARRDLIAYLAALRDK